ncbi:dolichol kinase [Caenorhabditis elegans]|uniref:dolichol kinase n=1 Tax=Caenorhabditis elegans TaxID=6239 RepID=Q56VX7_CAEEL|nr:dolichol kinase [Caenorhabditis elegans]CAI79280.2 dolichol kinase [Caenorhabditis elegans]|eukprot:NP_001355372.1 DOLichol Kinase [Caenorhabditis elegans]
MLGDEYGSLVVVATVATLVIVAASWILRHSPIIINAVFAVVISIAIFAFSSLVNRSIPETFELLFRMVIGPQDSWNRVYMVAFWLANVAISVIFCAYVSSIGRSSTVHRKFFHLTVSLIYISGILLDPLFSWLCAWLWLCIFTLVELLRYLNVPPWGGVLNEHLLIFKDAQDSELLLTPIYLLVGIFLPLMVSCWDVGSFQPTLAIFAGVAAVGVGDSMAAIVGSKFGVTKWKGSKKSLEGSIAMLFSMLVFLLTTNLFIKDSSSTISIIIASLVATLAEAFINSMDNFILPLVTYLIL